MSVTIKDIGFKNSADMLLEQLLGVDSLHFLIDFAVLLFDANTRGTEVIDVLKNASKQDAIQLIIKNNHQLANLNLASVGGTFPQINPRCKDSIINILIKLCTEQTRDDISAELFQYMLDRIILHNRNHYFFTPINLANMMARMLAPVEGELVLDPACGSGRLLAAANKQCKTCILEGIDIHDALATLSFFNLYFSGKAEISLLNANFLELPENKLPFCDVVLSNPPYKDDINVTIDFIEKIMQILKPNGRCGLLVPEGLLTNAANRRVLNLRQRLLKENYLEAVVSLPRKIYKPYTVSKSSLVLLRNQPTKPISKIFMCSLPEYDGPESGFSDAVYQSNMDQIIKAWQRFLDNNIFSKNSDSTEFFWTASYDEIIAKDYIFAADAYRQSEYLDTQILFEDLRDRILDDQSQLEKLFAQYRGVDL